MAPVRRQTGPLLAATVLEDDQAIRRLALVYEPQGFGPPGEAPRVTPGGSLSLRQSAHFAPFTARPRLRLVVTPHFVDNKGRLWVTKAQAELQLPPAPALDGAGRP
jgi:hypothetical protein